MKELKTWKEWMERWNDPKVTVGERMGLLHTGLSLKLQMDEGKEFQERLLFYIKEAATAKLRSKPITSAYEEQLARKAQSLIFSYLKNIDLRIFGQEELAALTTFFSESYKDGYYVNWSVPAPDSSGVNHLQYLIVHVFIELCNLVVSVQPWSTDPRSRYIRNHLRDKILLTCFKMCPGTLYLLYKDRVDFDLIIRMVKEFGRPCNTANLAYANVEAVVEWLLFGKGREAFSDLSRHRTHLREMSHADCLWLLLLNLDEGRFVKGALLKSTAGE